MLPDSGDQRIPFKLKTSRRYFMKFGKKARVALMLTAVSGVLFGLNLPTIAGTPGAGAPLIDKDFEIALRKFVSKRFFNRIDASDEQREKLSKIMAETQDETRPKREQLRQGMLDLSSMYSDGKSSDEVIKAKVKELRELHEKIQNRRLDAALAARKILTAEQMQKMHGRLSQLISGGIKPRRLSMLMQDDGPLVESN